MNSDETEEGKARDFIEGVAKVYLDCNPVGMFLQRSANGAGKEHGSVWDRNAELDGLEAFNNGVCELALGKAKCITAKYAAATKRPVSARLVGLGWCDKAGPVKVGAGCARYTAFQDEQNKFVK